MKRSETKMPRLPSEAQARIVRQINLTLEGPVADVMAQLVPELKKLPRRGVLECVLSDPDLLDRCFKAFRANTGRFHQLLVDEHDVPVEQADALLACGRSLEDVVAMVVRTCAKRHFRKRLDGDARPLKAGEHKAAAPKGLMGKLMRLLSLSTAEAKPKRSRGETLYDAMQEHLMHDWQVALVPEYSTLSPALVKRLGKRILDYKVPEDIRRLKENPSELPVPSTLPETIPAFLAPPTARTDKPKAAEKPQSLLGGDIPAAVHEVKAGGAAAPAASGDRRARITEILTPDQKRLRAAAFTMILLDPVVRAELPNADQTVRITGFLSETGGLSVKVLVGELGLRMDQLAVMALVIYDVMGEEMFKRSFGIPGNLEYVTKFVERAKAAGIDQDTALGEISAFIRKTFSSAPRAAQ